METEALPAEEASRIEELVEAAAIVWAEQATHEGDSAPDRFEYRLTIESRAWGRRTLVVTESAVREGMRPLLDHLTLLAMRGGRQGGAEGRRGGSGV
jgi:hypothetical protein